MRYYAETEDFVDVCRAVALARSVSDRALIGSQLGICDRAQRVLQKSSIGMLLGDSDSGENADYVTAATAFVESLRGMSIFDRLLDGGMKRAPSNAAIGNVIVAASGATVGETEDKPVGELLFDFGRMPLFKSTAIVAMSEELFRSQSAATTAMLETELRGAVAAAVDAEFLSVILTGASATGSAGASAANMRTNVGALLSGVAPRANSWLFFVATPAVAIKLISLSDAAGPAYPGVSPTGGEIANTPLLISDQLASGTLALVDASGLVADAGSITIDRARRADIVLDSSVNVSLWQSNLTAVRIERFWSAVVSRQGAVATITGL